MIDSLLGAFAEDVGNEGAIAVAGARTRWELGGALDPAARIVDAPSGVVNYQPEEMTVTVRAGTPVSELHQILAEAGQRTSLPERGGTVGGAIAVGENDYRCLGRGRLRDAVLQVRYVSAEGRIITSGGPTVKNVSGFDLPRLVCGSLGTLGLIGEVTLRTNPIPATSVWLQCVDIDPLAVFDALLDPSAVLSADGGAWVELEGHSVDVEAEQEKLTQLGPVVVVEGPPELPSHRWSVKTSELASLPLGSIACVGVGLGFARMPQERRVLDDAVIEVSRQLKAQFDPKARLNPGRSVF